MTFHNFRSAALPFAALVITACAQPTAAAPEPAAVMVGEWTYKRVSVSPAEAPFLNAGLRVSIAIDSARGMQFWGHVALWFAGDVGVPPARFGPVSGEIDPADGVSLRIESAEAQTLRIEGEVDGDMLMVHSSWAGVEFGPFPQGGLFQRLH